LHALLADLKHGASVQHNRQHLNLGQLGVDCKLHFHQLADGNNLPAVAHVWASNLLPRFVACDVQPLLRGSRRDLVVSGGE
jgi:hypothetical protein